LRIGLLADTHDYLKGIREALNVFEVSRVDHIFHLGDLCQPETVWEFTGIPMSYLLGNNDIEVVRLRRALKTAGIEYLGEQAEVSIDGKTLGLYHGTRESTTQRLIRSEKYDYLLIGHSHELEDYTIGRTRVINPGSIWGSDKRTVAVLEPQSGELEILEIT